MDDNSYELVINDSPLADIFLVKYAQDLSKESIIIYLWLNMTARKSGFDDTFIKKFKIVPDSGVDGVLSELMSHSLIIRKGDMFYLQDLKRLEVEEYIKLCRSGMNDSGSDALSSDENERNLLAGSISKTFYQGKMCYALYRLIDRCLYEYKFESQVCYRLFEEGFEKGIHRYVNAMESMAVNWYERGYLTTARLEAHIRDEEMIKKLQRLCGKMLRKRLDQMDIERITNWVQNFNANEDLVNLAFRVNEYRGKVTLINVEETLKNWFEVGADTFEKAGLYEEDKHKENSQKASRRRSRGAAKTAWRTGEEAGIADAGDKEKPDSKAEEKVAKEESKNLPAGVLEMFGGSDEDN